MSYYNNLKSPHISPLKIGCKYVVHIFSFNLSYLLLLWVVEPEQKQYLYKHCCRTTNWLYTANQCTDLAGHDLCKSFHKV